MLQTGTSFGQVYALLQMALTDEFHNYFWCDQAKSVWSWSNSVFIFLNNHMHHFHSYILQKIQLKLVYWFQRYE